MIIGPESEPLKAPAPEDTETTCQAAPAQIATDLRAAVRGLRIEQRNHGPTCRGHPVTLGHMLALRIADLLDRGPES